MEPTVPVEEAVALTRELVRINTTNPPGAEAPCIDVLERRLAAAGFETDRRPYLNDPSRAQLVARLRGTGERPGVLLSGHVDVVPPGNVPWTVEPFGAEMRDGLIYGRGSCDMKSGVAALTVAAEAIARCGQTPRGDIVLVITADEERYCLGAEALVKEPLFEGLGSVIVAEPTSLVLFVAEKGAFCAEVTFYGRTAHGSMPHLGANAITAMADFLDRWEERIYPSKQHHHPLLGYPSLNVGTITGGVKVNVVPDQCTAQLDMRTTPDLDHAWLRNAMEEVMAAVTESRPGTRADYTLLFERPPVACPPDSPLARALGEAVRDIAGVDPTPQGVPYCTEACIWVPDLGLDAVICGPGAPGMAHQPDESVEVREIELAARVYAQTLRKMLL